MKKKIEIMYEEGEGLDKLEFKGKVTLKRLNFSEKNSLEEESTDIKIFGNTPQVKVSTSKMKELSILKSVIGCELQKITFIEDKVTKAHMPVVTNYLLDINGIRDLPQEVGDELFLEFTQLNSVDKKKN